MEEITVRIDQIYVPVGRQRNLDPNTVKKIAESILEVGLEVPISLRRDGERFVLVSGLHRLEACKALGDETVAAIVVGARQR
ncbi:MAG: ParB N-terminal domain-containing protein [Kiloniellales bacterium]